MRILSGVHFTLTMLFIFWSSISFARTQSGVEILNGYEVHFVDSSAGDQFSVSFEIPLGRLSENAEFIGRARLLQTYLAGQFPLEVNAFTDLGSTVYSVHGRTGEAHQLLSGLLAPFHELEWKEDKFNRAKAIVAAEAELRGPLAEEDFLYAMMFSLLLPRQHPWSATPLGDPAAIAKMNLNGIRDYWLANYHSGNVKITVRGNFSDPLLYENVKTWTEEALPPEGKFRPLSKLAPLATKWAPSMFGFPNDPVESDRRLYISSKSARFGLAVMEADISQFREPHLIDRLVDKLNAKPFPGGGEAMFHADRIGNKVHLTFIARPDNAEQIEALNLEAFKRLRTEQNSDAQGPAKLFHPQRALYVEMGPEIEEMEVDEKFRRAYKLIDNRAALRRYVLPFAEESCESRLRARAGSEIGG